MNQHSILETLDAAIALLTTSQEAGSQDADRYEAEPFVVTGRMRDYPVGPRSPVNGGYTLDEDIALLNTNRDRAAAM